MGDSVFGYLDIWVFDPNKHWVDCRMRHFRQLTDGRLRPGGRLFKLWHHVVRIRRLADPTFLPFGRN